MVKIPVRARSGGADVDPTSDVVSLAFLPSDAKPASGDWKAGTWDTDTGRYYAQCRIGPGGTITLQPETTYAVWIKIVHGADTVVRRAGSLRPTV